MATIPVWDDGTTTWDEPGVVWDITLTPVLPPTPGLPVDPNTVYTDFIPSPSINFQFNPTLDGISYTAIVNWNLFGQRYYFNLYTVQGELILALPLIGSPKDYNISLVAGYFTSTLVYRIGNAQFETTP